MGVVARDIGQSLEGVRNSFSSWDSCMAKSYCKWPVIAAIILGSLIVLSLLWCVFRCLCCGVECCCGCLACCNACCPSPRRRDKGYEQAPPTPYQYQQPPPMHSPFFASGAAGYGGARSVAQTATFESPSQKYHEDALPAMPSWSNASSRRIEQQDDDVELAKMDTHAAASAVPTHQNPRYYSGQETGSTADLGYRGQETRPTADLGYRGQETGSNGDIGYMGAGHAHMHAQPYQDYDQQRQQVPSPYATQRSAADYYTGAQAGEQSPYGAHNSYYNNPVADPYAVSGYDRNPTAPAAYRSPMSGTHGAGAAESAYPQPSPDYHHYSGAQTQSPSHYAQPKPYENCTSPSPYRNDSSPPEWRYRKEAGTTGYE